MKPEIHDEIFRKVTAMEDSRIVDLYWARNEQAISESDKKYGRMLHSLSYSLLSSHEDAEECVNDTYVDAWDAIPPARPQFLGAFLSKITRRISIDRFRERHRDKRGGIDNLCAELSECIASEDDTVREYDSRRITEEINAFLLSQPKQKRVMFVLRYFYSESIEVVALKTGASQSSVKTALFRMRGELRKRLEEQDLL